MAVESGVKYNCGAVQAGGRSGANAGTGIKSSAANTAPKTTASSAGYSKPNIPGDYNGNGIPDQYETQGQVQTGSTYQGKGNNQVSQNQSSFWSGISDAIRQIAAPVRDFVQGVGAGVFESITFGASRELEAYYNRDNEIVYLIGKVVGNTGISVVSGAGTLVSGAATVTTSPTGVGAIAFGAATAYSRAVTVSAGANAAANIMQIKSIASGGGGNSRDAIEGTTSTANKIPWGSWSDYEKVTVNGQEYAKVGERLYSRHAVDRMQPSGFKYPSGQAITQAGGSYGRSVAPQYVEDVINSVKPIVQENGNLKYVGGSLEVITNPQGAVVTIMTK